MRTIDFIAAAACAAVLAGCGGGSEPQAPLPAPVGKHVAYIASDPSRGGVDALFVVDTGTPEVVHRLGAPLRRNERVDRFVVSPVGGRVGYVTYRWQLNREELRFTSLDQPDRATRFALYDDQGVADVRFMPDGLGFIALVAHRGATPPVQLPAGMAVWAEADDDAVVYALDGVGTDLDVNYGFAIAPDGQAVFLHQGGSVRRVAVSAPGAIPSPATTLPGLFSGDWAMRVTDDASYLLGTAASLFGAPTDGSAPAVVLRNGYLPDPPVNAFDADADASHVVFMTSSGADTALHQTSRATPGASNPVALPDPAYQARYPGPRFLPGTTRFVVPLVDPAAIQPAGLYLFDATGANPPLRLSGASSELVQQLVVVDADTVVYVALESGASAVRQVEVAAPGAPIELMSARNTLVGALTVCGGEVAYGLQGLPWAGVWAATLGQAGSASRRATVDTGVAYAGCLP